MPEVSNWRWPQPGQQLSASVPHPAAPPPQPGDVAS
jgi:hypothetical protein